MNLRGDHNWLVVYHRFFLFPSCLSFFALLFHLCCRVDTDEQSSTTIDPVYELLRKAGDVGRRPGGLSSSHSIADRNWTQVMGQMGILPPHHSSAYHRARSSASSSGSSASSHFGQSHLSVASNPLHASSSGKKEEEKHSGNFSLDESSSYSLCVLR